MRNFIDLAEQYLSEMSTADKIAALRAKTVANGATPAEAASAAAKADELEIKHLGQAEFDRNRTAREKEEAKARNAAQAEAAKKKKQEDDQKARDETRSQRRKSPQAAAIKKAIQNYINDIGLQDEVFNDHDILYQVFLALLDAYDFSTIKQNFRDAVLDYEHENHTAGL